MKPGRLSFLIALGASILVTGALVIWTCQYDSRDACYIMQGLAVYLGPIALLVLWPIAYGGCWVARLMRNPPQS